MLKDPQKNNKGKNKSFKVSLKDSREFFAYAAHELRTPLTIIKGNLDLIFLEEKKSPLDPNICKLIENINAELGRLSRMLGGSAFIGHYKGYKKFSATKK